MQCDQQVVCELLYALMEYTKTVMFMWMLIEGMYLHNMLVLSVFSGKPNYVIYYSLGWGMLFYVYGWRSNVDMQQSNVNAHVILKVVLVLIN